MFKIVKIYLVIYRFAILSSFFASIYCLFYLVYKNIFYFISNHHNGFYLAVNFDFFYKTIQQTIKYYKVL